jgi:hypothetical protein
MARRRTSKPNPNDVDELELTIDPMTGLPALKVVPRTTPVPDKPRRWGGRKK